MPKGGRGDKRSSGRDARVDEDVLKLLGGESAWGEHIRETESPSQFLASGEILGSRSLIYEDLLRGKDSALEPKVQSGPLRASGSGKQLHFMPKATESQSRLG